MTTETAPDIWSVSCTTADCELKNIQFPVTGDEAECGGCGEIFTRP